MVAAAMGGAAPAPGSLLLVTRLSRAVHRRMAEGGLRMGLKPYGMLCYLRDREAVTQQELGEAMYLDKNSIVLMLNELEASGFAARRRDPGDRRRHIVELTEAGKGEIQRVERWVNSVEGEMLAALSDEERATLRRLLERALEPHDADAAREPAAKA